MRPSSFFTDLRAAYEAEIDDLTTDSGGHDVLGKRLQAKRSQLAQLIPMLEYSPEMVAPAFYGAFSFRNPDFMREVTAREPDDLPSWSALQKRIELAPWATELAALVLRETAGDRFLVLTACVEYLRAIPATPVDTASALPASTDDKEANDDYDLDEAGADWLAEQGFDYKDRFSGE